MSRNTPAVVDLKMAPRSVSNYDLKGLCLHVQGSNAVQRLDSDLERLYRYCIISPSVEVDSVVRSPDGWYVCPESMDVHVLQVQAELKI